MPDSPSSCSSPSSSSTAPPPSGPSHALPLGDQLIEDDAQHAHYQDTGPETQHQLGKSRPEEEVPTSKEMGSLHVVSAPTSSVDDEPKPTSQSFDVIVVPGVYDDLSVAKDDHSDPKVAPWIQEFMDWLPSDSRLIYYRYKSDRLFSARWSREVVRDYAVHFLRSLSTLRNSIESQSRKILFVAYDIGGILVKDALVTATHDLTSWSDILDMARILVFMGYPHRSADDLQMQNRLARFLYSADAFPEIRDTLPPSVILKLAEAIATVNAQFLASKVVFRTRLAFDIHTASSGFPLETCLEESTEAKFPNLVEHLKTQIQQYLDLTLDSKRFLQERTLLSVAPPIHPLCNTTGPHDVPPVSQIPEYEDWIKPDGPPMLHIHGTGSLHEVGELLFLARRDRAQDQNLPSYKRELVLYFSFDRWDSRRNSISAMVSTILAQIVGFELPSWKNLGGLIDWQRCEHGWTESDLLHWLFRFSTTSKHGSIVLILNHLDHCAEESQLAFFEWLSRLSITVNGPWRVAITSYATCTALNKLPAGSYTSLDIDQYAKLSPGIPDLQVDNYRLITYRPDLLLDKDNIPHFVETIKKLAPNLRHLALTQTQTFTERSGTTSASIETVTADLDQLSRCVANQELLRRFLVLLLYAKRPLSIWELNAALRVGCEDDKDPALCPDLPKHPFLRDISALLTGIIKMDNMEVNIDNGLRSVLMARNPPGDSFPHTSQHVWDDLCWTAHHDITNACLEYLSDPNNSSTIETIIRAGGKRGMLIAQDHTNFCSYALHEWPYHFAQSSIAQQAVIIERFLKPHPNLETQLASGNWALSNAITRIEPSPTSFFPIFTGLGLVDVWEPRDVEDATRGILEAALRGREKVVKVLLESICDDSTLLEVLVAAASSGNASLLLHLTEHIKSNSKDPTKIPWPPVLLHRASRLNLTSFAQELLCLACSPVVEFPESEHLCLTPLAYAICNRHSETLQVMVKYPSLTTVRIWDEMTMLHYAAMWDNEEAITLLINEAKLDIEAKDCNGYTSLTPAACHGPRAVKRLLELGADPVMGISPSDNLEWTPLADAASKGYDKCVQLLLEHGADPNMGGQVWPLQEAVQAGHVEATRVLLDYGADPESPLIMVPLLAQVIYSSINNGPSICQLLLQKDVNVNRTDDNGWTPLHLAAYFHKPAITKLLLEHGADPDKQSESGVTPLYFALTARDSPSAGLEVVRLLLQHEADPNIATNGMTSLHWAVTSQSSPEFITLLLEHNAKIDAGYDLDGDDQSQWTAVYFAASYNKCDQMRLLIEAGANLRHTAADGRSLIHLSATNDTLPILLEYLGRFDINAADEHGRTALHSVNSINLPNIKRLVNAGAKLDVPDAARCTPLRYAVASKNVDKVLLLLSKGADPNLCDGPYGPPFSVASLHNSGELTELLLKHGSRVDAEDLFGRRPIHYAAWGGVDNIQRLLDAGGDINVRDKLGRTPLHWAAQSGCSKAVERILAISPDQVDDLDKGGWTPFCSACIGPSRLFSLSEFGLPKVEGEDQLEVLRILIDHGANTSAHVTIGGKACDPYQIAKLCSAPEPVIRMLQRSSEDKGGGLGQVVDATTTPDRNQKLRLNSDEDLFCDACGWQIRGHIHKDRTFKPGADFCFRCYPIVKTLYPADHKFEEDDGSEFEKESDPESSSDSDVESTEDEYSDDDDE
ncbi:ankyrin repeat-containing domain protein [Copromyces sp. CBS 386.78]|nr:ankyrin repeat-containing domain protein [Copromyces sp. CBS 386.78]